MSFEAGTVASVRASHVMPGFPPPEGELHAHDYRIEVTVERDDLDDAGMVVDLDALRDALGSATSEVSGVDLNEHLRAAQVTVERFARWMHGRILDGLGDVPGGTLRVRVWEAPDAFGGYSAPAG
jgi:6-pyruvoyltetrahydropterin/6-carboxytetrahydropterin synthase